MLLVTDSGKRFVVDVLEDVQFIEVNKEMIGAFYAYWKLCSEQGVRGVCTGAAREPAYLKEPLHLAGFAWDFRSYIFEAPLKAASRLAEILKGIDTRYRVVYIKPPKPVHFHVEFRR